MIGRSGKKSAAGTGGQRLSPHQELLIARQHKETIEPSGKR
jgi:hypothetical protein